MHELLHAQTLLVVFSFDYISRDIFLRNGLYFTFLIGNETVLPEHFTNGFLDLDNILKFPWELQLNRPLMDVKKIGLINMIVFIDVLFLLENRLVDYFGDFEEGFLAVEEAFRPVYLEFL